MYKKAREVLHQYVENGDVAVTKGGFLTISNDVVPKKDISGLAVLIHSFVPGEYTNNPWNPYFEQNRDAFVEQFPGTILLGVVDFKERSGLEYTLPWITSIDHQGPRFIYFTRGMSAHPSKPTKAQFITKIREHFDPESIIVGGAEVHEPRRSTFYFGCAGATYELLKRHFATTLDRSLSWMVPRR